MRSTSTPPFISSPVTPSHRSLSFSRFMTFTGINNPRLNGEKKEKMKTKVDVIVISVPFDRFEIACNGATCNVGNERGWRR
mmetsp:Transcript_20831/g.23795  ORF Transcript_20831/g.23795 Transcript_20831/m.23795 type:complete len:81 (-) Transcript_20831:19-261(-)